MEDRLVRPRRTFFLVAAVTLFASGPWIGWWWMIPLTVAAGAFAVSDSRMRKSTRPVVWSAVGWGISVVMIAVSVALTGGPQSPVVAWFALPAVTVTARFERRGSILAVIWMLVGLVASTLLVAPDAVWHNPTPVMFAIGMTIASVILSTAVAQSDRDHRQEAVLDPLTGLPNRTALAQRLAELEEQARRNTDPASIGFIVADLDHFKLINDQNGHDVGDEVLRDAAHAMRVSLRAFDQVYRVGGEEFVLVLPGARLDDTVEVAERVRVAVSACSRPELPVTISLGAASVTGTPDFDSMYTHADRALYDAKHAGRNRVCVASGYGEQRTPAPAAAPAAA